MIFETHAHYDDEAFDGDRDELLKKMHDHGIGKIINVGASLKGVRDTAALTEKYSFVYGAVGIHPEHVGDMREEDLEWLRGLLAGANVVMPNISPRYARENYRLYDNKLNSGSEAAEGYQELRRRIEGIGYHIAESRGDCRRS